MHPDRLPWTQQELDTLDKLLGKVSAATIAKRLKRTETSVVMKIKALAQEISLGKVDQTWFLDLVLLKGLAYMQGYVAGI